MNQLLMPGQSKPLDLRTADGSLVLTVQVDRHHEGVSIAVSRHPALDRTFTNDRLDEGRAYLQFLYDEARKGTQVFLIEAAAGVLTSAGAVVDQAEQDIIDGVNANIDRMTAPQPSTVDVSGIVTGDGWRAERKAAQAAATLAAYQRNGRRDFSKGRTHRKPPTEAELGRIRAARDNGDGTLTVTRAPGQSWLVLSALHARIGGTPTYRPNSRIIDSLTFPVEQLAGYQTEAAA